jgi:hypothetical protein
MKNFLKSVIGSCYRFLHDVNNKNLTVFLFHEITNSPSDFQREFKLYHNIQDFIKIINWIDKKYNIISPNNIKNVKIKKKAIITFDDGFKGSFIHGVPYLIKKKIPSIHFINLRPILKKKPNLVSFVNYMKNNDSSFGDYVKKHGISTDVHLRITPLLLNRYIKQNYKVINFQDILSYQGKLIDRKIIKKYIKNNLVYFGNHLYEHWNSKKLNINYFKKYFYKNNKLFKKNFKKKLDFFAFPHGIPLESFTNKQKNFIIKENKISFYSSSGDNFDIGKLLNRVCVSRYYIENNIIYYLFLRNIFKN